MAYKTGERVRAAREFAGISAKVLAEKIGVSSSRLSNWETGVNRPMADQIAMISKVLNVSANYLLGITDEITNINHPMQGITIAAHADGELNDDDLKDIKQYIAFKKSQRKQREES